MTIVGISPARVEVENVHAIAMEMKCYGFITIIVLRKY